MSENCLVQIMAPNEEWFRVLPNANQLATDVIQRAVRESGRAHADSEVSVVFSDDRELQLLNKEYRSVDKPTNVLSFPGPELPAEDPNAYTVGGRPHVLGDIVLALETTQREAKEQGKELKHHVAHLLVHGTLHLLRYDHENDADAERMEGLERKVLAALGIGDPYVVEGDDDQDDEPAPAAAYQTAAAVDSEPARAPRRKKTAAPVMRAVKKARARPAPRRTAAKAAAPKRAKPPARKTAAAKPRRPTRAATKRSAPRRQSAKAAAPKRAAAKRLATKRAAPQRAVPKRAVPKRVASKRVTPKRAAARKAPKRVAHPRVTPRRASPRRAAPKRSLARRAAPRVVRGKSRTKKR